MTQSINQAAGQPLTLPNINIPINQATSQPQANGQPQTNGQPLIPQNVNLLINPAIGQPLIPRNDNIS
ncbi:15037_t:CDS:1, partial [Racocetra persica]